MSLPAPGTFPLASGTHPLEVTGGRLRARLRSEPDRPAKSRVGDALRLAAAGIHATDSPRQVAERPIVIK